MRNNLALTVVLLALTAPASPVPLEADGIHNLFRVSDRIYCGSGPEGEKAFAALAKLGVKTVISVDGARPDVELAKKHGLRYVHIPFGYDGVPEPQVLQLAKAVLDLPGPFYIHCHHGKHRGPTAAAVAQLCSDEKCSVETALELLKKAGTDPRYTGLFGSVQKLQRPTAKELAGLPKSFPEAVAPAGVVAAMVAIDQAWDNLKLVRTAGWKTPPEHPDIDPKQEAKQLAEHYQTMSKLPRVQARPEDFRRWLTEAQSAAALLENTLRSDKLDRDAAEKAFKASSQICTQCHGKYRDVP